MNNYVKLKSKILVSRLANLKSKLYLMGTQCYNEFLI